MFEHRGIGDADGNRRSSVDALRGGDLTLMSLPSEVHVALPDGTQARVREMTEWGVRAVLHHSPALTLCETIEMTLLAEERVVIACRGRVLGIVEFALGYEIMLWIVGDNGPWRRLVQRLNPTFELLHSEQSRVRSNRLAADRIIPRLKALSSFHARALVRSVGSPQTPALPARLDPDRGILLEWSPEWATLEGPYEIQVEGPFSTLRFVEDSLSWNGVPSPQTATVTRRRQMRRVSVPSGARVILHGIGPDNESLNLRMHDVSFGGVSAYIDGAAPHLTRGTEISEIVVTWRGGPGLRFSGEVRHRSITSRSGAERIGLQLSRARDAQHERWTREVETLLYPTTRGHGHNFEMIWNLYEESGYFDLSEHKRQSSDFQQLRASFEHAYGRLITNPELGSLAYCESATRVEATLTGLRMWSRSWLGMHLARSPMRPHFAGSDSVPLRDIHFHVYERAGANPDLEWIISFVRDDAPRLSKALYTDLFLSVPGSCAVPFEAWKFNVYMRGELLSPGVFQADDSQLAYVLGRLEDIRPAPYLEAFDLLPETFHQEELRAEWAFHGLFRERAMMVAIEHRRIVAAAVLEAVEDGLHLYGLLDSARLYELEPSGSEYFGPLLVAANEWFYAMGKSSFVCFEENGLEQLMRSAGGKSIGTAVATHLPRTSTPELLERIAELSAPK